MSPMHISATVQVSSSSPPLLDASLGPAASLHSRVPASPRGPDYCPAASLGLPSREAPTLHTPTRRVPRLLHLSHPTRVRGTGTDYRERCGYTPPSRSPLSEEGGSPLSPGLGVRRHAGGPRGLPVTAVFRVNVPWREPEDQPVAPTARTSLRNQPLSSRARGERREAAATAEGPPASHTERPRSPDWQLRRPTHAHGRTWSTAPRNWW